MRYGKKEPAWRMSARADGLRMVDDCEISFAFYLWLHHTPFVLAGLGGLFISVRASKGRIGQRTEDRIPSSGCGYGFFGSGYEVYTDR